MMIKYFVCIFWWKFLGEL